MSWSATAAVRADVAPERIWDVLLDGRGWSRWNPGIAWMVLEGAPVAGTTVTTKPRGAPQTALRIEAAVPARLFALVLTIGPLAALRLRWELRSLDGATELVQTVATSGPLGDLLLRRSARRIAGGMEANLVRLAALAREPA